MKKLLLSGFVILAFFAYSIFQRQEATSGNINLISPNTVSPNTYPTVTPATSTTIPTTTPTTAVLPPSAVRGKFRDGSYTGDVADAYYGNIQVQVVITGGKITAVNFLQYPNDRGRSVEINTYAMPILQSEAIQAQSANVDLVSGATDSSQAFIASLQSALARAQ